MPEPSNTPPQMEDKWWLAPLLVGVVVVAWPLMGLLVALITLAVIYFRRGDARTFKLTIMLAVIALLWLIAFTSTSPRIGG